MTTVKEFKDLGVPFVVGDKYIHSDGKSERLADGISLGWFHAGSVSALSAVITHFTWRPLNTLPDNPRFKFEYNSGSIRVQWRPLLDQSGAMADEVELPPVGCKAVVSLREAGYSAKSTDCEYEDKVVTVMAVFKNKYGTDIISIQNDTGGCACFTHECVKPIDIRTPKQKAVDEAMVMWPVADKPTLEFAYDLWAK